MWLIAALTVALAVGGWLGIRYERESQRIDTDIRRFLLSIPPSEWKQ